ncbi:hypothetical protein OHT77_00395 [Streptomyces sp. NBC_00252]|uniref:hypothetical protein n=1 Tax=Streptomyces sp. NBC_00252 TaxID=2975691 RepID=UPI002E29249D|nr:hypothetical protein [Streptomyces sp. NBC_00252]
MFRFLAILQIIAVIGMVSVLILWILINVSVVSTEEIFSFVTTGHWLSPSPW